jgi:tetratricopeptide (TPR) repeat protein
MADYDEAIRLNPKDAHCHNNRGNLWSDKGDLDRAIADYSEAIRIDPSFALPYLNRGNLWHRRGDKAKASADYLEALRLDPTVKDRVPASYQEDPTALVPKELLNPAFKPEKP